MIVIPDVHGRLFWKDAVAQRKDDETVIFLGDYLDPYPNIDNIYAPEALVNFYDIIYYARNNPNVVMLLGNHDMWYLNMKLASCRQDFENMHEIRQLFHGNSDLFKIAYSEKSGRRSYLFSHAGIHTEWLDMLNSVFPQPEEDFKVADYLNTLFLGNRAGFMNYLDIVPWSRGGSYGFGSCIWADVTEWLDKYNKFIPGYYQVFGHSLCRAPIIEKKFAMLDCRQAFRIDKNDIIAIKKENEEETV